MQNCRFKNLSLLTGMNYPFNVNGIELKYNARYKANDGRTIVLLGWAPDPWPKENLVLEEPKMVLLLDIENEKTNQLEFEEFKRFISTNVLARINN